MDNEQLAALIQAGENEAENMLILWQQNKGFIAKLARKYQGYAELDDLLQEGYIGLCEAVRHYDRGQGVSFINYAAFWIKQTIQRYIDNCGSSVRIPVHAREWVKKYNRIVREYRKYYGREPSKQTLCALLGVSMDKLTTIQEDAKKTHIRSLSEAVGGDDDITLADTLASDEDMKGDIMRELDRETMKRELWIAVDRLPGNLPEVVRHRYVDGMTLKETGRSMDCSISRAGELERKAFRMLRLPGRCKKFRGYYEEYLAAAPVHHVGLESFKRTRFSEVEREVLGW